MSAVPLITGRTRIYALVAHPSAHVRTPQLFNAVLAERGTDLVTVAVDVAPAGLAAMVAAFRSWQNLAGIGVTVPHKEAVVALVDELGPQAALVGAANVIRREPDGRLVGEMFDGTGFVAGLRAAGHDPAGRRVLLAGAGGTARAIAFALAAAGVSELVITNRTAHRAEGLAADVGRAHPALAVAAGDPDPTGMDLVVNATTLGMHDEDPLPIPAERLDPATLVAEVVMSPEKTALLLAAAARGCPVQPGVAMLAAQRDFNLAWIGHLDSGKAPA